MFGDYDVDGVCSTAILVRALRALGGDPAWELPEPLRRGLRPLRGRGRAPGRARAPACWSRSTAASRPSRRSPRRGPRASTWSSPTTTGPATRCPTARSSTRRSADYGCPELCAAGVALKLSEALHAAAGGDPPRAEEDLDLAALATVCDLVPLRGENRRIVREGLVGARAAPRKPGLRALMEVAGVEPAELDRARARLPARARASTPPGACSAPTPRSSCC